MYDIYLENIEIDGQMKDVAIENGIIKEILPHNAEKSLSVKAKEKFDGKGMVAVPGFVNMHTHAAMSLMRGVGEDIAFHEWLDRVWKIENRLDEEFVYWAGSRTGAFFLRAILPPWQRRTSAAAWASA